jgi:murein DD-endopeptidase MepM/ murein hydrolase activator NlpD
MILPVRGKITSNFGYRVHPITKENLFHNGIDISCHLSTPVLAPDDGIIIEQWEHPTGGISLAMVKGNVRFGFAHLSGYSCNLGDRVKKGEVIAYSGNTGRSTGPHLHFTMKINDEWVNPLDFA